MKSYSDDHVSREQLDRATEVAVESNEVAKATLATSSETLMVTKRNQKLLKVIIGLGIINLILTAGTLGLLVRPLIG